jgi:hypothetical protein
MTKEEYIEALKENTEKRIERYSESVLLAVAGGAYLLKRRQCKIKHPDDPEGFKRCMKTLSLKKKK